MFQIALMGMTKTLVGFIMSFWWAFEGIVDSFNSFLFSIPLLGDIAEVVINIVW